MRQLADRSPLVLGAIILVPIVALLISVAWSLAHRRGETLEPLE